MDQDRLYLIRPDFFHDGRGPLYCPGCAEILGLLDVYPSLKDRVSLHYVDFDRPRPELVALLGEENQSCPVLILSRKSEERAHMSECRRAQGLFFVEGAREIGAFFATTYGTGIPF
ncbi:MAG: DUF3088 family protein [Verrucomicrobiae bacterium]|nr:DUF3088 family protein [Verrucomicrobiae bacterium]